MMGRMSRVFALLGVALWLGWSGEALAAARVALVIGNSDTRRRSASSRTRPTTRS